MRSTIPWRVAVTVAAVLSLADGLQAQPPGGGRCGQNGPGRSFSGGPGRQGRPNLLMTRLQQQQNGFTNPNTLLNALQRRETSLQNALQRTNDRLNALQQSGSTNQTALVNALLQRQTA